ncbi:MAG: PLP-dependent aminotransferase family protein [Corynebacterium sp.]|nr:PLP-dependent aminotransferase family protein [Corynebacterium sp.]
MPKNIGSEITTPDTAGAAQSSGSREATADAMMAHFADRAAGFRPSAVRDVFEVAMQPGIISLAGGNPDLSLLPRTELADFAHTALVDLGDEILQYGSGAGYEPLAELICSFMRTEGAHPQLADIQLTAGSQMGLDLVTKLFVNPGDVIITEGPTYTGALGTFAGYQAQIQHVAVDEHGMQPELLEQAIEELKALGHKVSFVYLIPNFQNPTGVTIPPERRKQLLEICRRHEVLVVEDNPYGLLGFSQQRTQSLYSLDPENVIYLGSFSKIFSPGMRVGWMVAPAAVRKFLQIASEAVNICPAMLSQRLTYEYMQAGMWEPHLERSAALYQQRCAAVLAALEKHMPTGTHWTKPTGGFFTWVTLPDSWEGNTAYLLAPAIEAGVVFVPGSAFYEGQVPTGMPAPAAPLGQRELRIAYSGVAPEELSTGVQRLAQVVRAVSTDNAT